MYMKAQLLTACALTLGVAAAARPVTAPVATPDLSGTYVIDRGASDDPRKAVEKATSSMRRFKRNAVNKRLQGEMKAPDTLRIVQQGDSVTLAAAGRMRLTVVPGTAKSRTGQRGGSVETTSEWQGNALLVRTSAERFQREARYSLEGDGSRIRVAIAMRAEQMPEPIRYTLVYRRVAGTADSD
ncbi:MAG TPA: hypothetical protein VFZ21_15975 [Gemmatimonadaceae bacterium]|nr:hypothetical protein [Gemmatimonadaceae bacterium]